MYQELRERICTLNKMLPNENLVVWTGGNVSGIVEESNHIVIKPSGILFENLTPESMIVIDMECNVVEGDYKPSVDSSIHAYLYKKRPDIKGICHTHSPYATSFALLGEKIPAALTPLGHLTGCDIPCTRYAQAGHEDTGDAIMEADKDGCGVLVKRHGVFTYGKSPEFAVKVATHIEEAAQTVHYAMMRGTVTSLPDDELARCASFYKDSYGQ